MTKAQEELASITNPSKAKGTLSEVIKGADAFLGVSRPGLLTGEMVRSMAKDPIIFAMANPTPEIFPAEALDAGAAVVATGRSDFPNQVNNCLGFPGIFRGALDVRAKDKRRDEARGLGCARFTCRRRRAFIELHYPVTARSEVARRGEAVAEAARRTGAAGKADKGRQTCLSITKERSACWRSTAAPLRLQRKDPAERCRDLLTAFRGRITPSYSVKANTNPSLLEDHSREGLSADAMSPGEIFVLERSGFGAKEIFYIGNNVSREEMSCCIERGILVSVDSLSQLEQFGMISPGSRVAVRFNPGTGAGPCDKVITAGHNTKFGVQRELSPEVKKIHVRYTLKLAGINQHIGSLFLEPAPMSMQRVAP